MAKDTSLEPKKNKNGWMAHFEALRKGKFNQLAKFIPNMMADIPEQEKLIILIDIVGFSKSSTREQVYTIYMFQQYLLSQIITSKIIFKSKIHINQFIPTGDGCYIIADKCEQQPAMEFLIALVSGFSHANETDGEGLSLRVSALLGSCVPFMDMAHHFNYVGEGMNEAARILTCGQAVLEQHYIAEHSDTTETTEKLTKDAKHFSRNCLFLGVSLACVINQFADKCSNIYTFRDVADKHGITRNITVMQNVCG
jgi:hypothetical protein